jgi:hypothetical protein
MIIKAIIVFLGLTTGNFILQFFRDQDWAVAFERSFFQAIAIIAYILVIS